MAYIMIASQNRVRNEARPLNSLAGFLECLKVNHVRISSISLLLYDSTLQIYKDVQDRHIPIPLID